MKKSELQKIIREEIKNTIKEQNLTEDWKQQVYYKVGDTYHYVKDNPRREFATTIKQITKDKDGFVFVTNQDKTIFKIGVVKGGKFQPRS